MVPLRDIPLYMVLFLVFPLLTQRKLLEGSLSLDTPLKLFSFIDKIKGCSCTIGWFESWLIYGEGNLRSRTNPFVSMVLSP